jgi:hypothetical protein
MMIKGVTISVNNGLKSVEESQFDEADIQKYDILKRKLGYVDEEGKEHGLKEYYNIVCENDLLKNEKLFMTARHNEGFEMLVGELFICGVEEENKIRSLTPEEVKEVKDCLFREVLRYDF